MNTHLRSPNASSSFPSLLSRTFADLSRKVRTQRKEQPLVQSLWERAPLEDGGEGFQGSWNPRERGRRLNMQNTFFPSYVVEPLAAPNREGKEKGGREHEHTRNS